MREIIYVETSPGVMESAAERRQRRVREKEMEKKRKKRAELIDGLLIVAFMATVFVAYFIAWAWAWNIAHRH